MMMSKWLAAAGILWIAGCGSSMDSGHSDSNLSFDGSSSSGSGSPGSTGSGEGSTGSGEESSDPGDAPPPPSTGQEQSGSLTAGVWDDNLNFDYFSDYRDDMFDQGGAGLLDFDMQDHEAAKPAGQAAANITLDIAFVLDTTGSMGDELGYLKAEFNALAVDIQQAYPNSEPRWSLVVYRDEGDAYLSQKFDFTSDASEFLQELNKHSVAGGGDYPEAPDQGLADASTLSWRTDDTTARLAFWVADAPHHNSHSGAMSAAISSLAAQDIHVYPVAASGVDELAELTMRSAAQLTGGRYVFLTDDSGIGDSHKEPNIPCYFVTLLDDAVLRMVEIELTGIYREPHESEIIRVGGDPENGVCSLSSGEQVFAF